MKLSIFLLFFITSIGYSQTQAEAETIKRSTDIDILENLKNDIKAYNKARNLRIANYKSTYPDLKLKYKKGKDIYVLKDIVSNIPIYQSTTNVEAAKGTRTNFIQPGGDLGLNLEGENMNIAIWEVGGKTLDTHVEFQQNGNSKIIFSDNAVDTTFHSTHVSGTLVANGVNPDAKGMAPKATLKSYDVIDVENEVADEVSNNALLISNHSYGVAVEGEDGTIPTWIMGSYSNDARTWDLIANANPYYLSVFSAGNSGSTDYSGGLSPGYDKLTYEKVSKNNLVVGNASFVNLDFNGDVLFGLVNINSSSSQGPSDDGRIKPDITGMGTNILSTSDESNTSYGSATGTSMASPNVAGSLLLLQELYNNVNNNYMRSSTLKCLALNTASDAGNTGPDAKFGWGLLNAKKAANTILKTSINESIIHEFTLEQDATFSFDVLADGVSDLEVMIVWNDPAGSAINGTLNSPTPALVNDLDLRVYDDDDTYFPWKLDLADVTQPAIQADNIVDNVEKVLVENTTPGETYTIEVSHKNNLDNQSQVVSIVVNGITDTTLGTKALSENEIIIYPNPASDILFIEGLPNNNFDFKLFNIQGKLMDQGQISSIKNSINTQNLERGTYFLKLSNGISAITKKIIKK